MENLKPNMCKSEGPLTVCDCTGNNIKEERRKCLTYEQQRRKQNEVRMQDHRFEYRLFCFALCLAIFFLYACSGSGGSDGTDSGNGSVSFALKWEDNVSASVFRAARSPSGDVCVDYGIELIAADVFDTKNTAVASDSWPCSDHQGILNEVPAGTGYSLIIEGIPDSGDADWRGEIAGITVTAEENTDAGTVTMVYVGDDATPPDVMSTNPFSEKDCVPLDTVITAVFSEAMVSASVNESTFILKNGTITMSGTVTYEPSTQAATFTPYNNLSLFNRYTATITTEVEDMAGNQMAEEVTWSFTTAYAGDYDSDCDVDGSDLSTFVSAYEAGSSDADLNDDGDVNAEDIEDFCRNFGNPPM